MHLVPRAKLLFQQSYAKRNTVLHKLEHKCGNYSQNLIKMKRKQQESNNWMSA